jgi:deoxyribodipyrimidine photo-lyase
MDKKTVILWFRRNLRLADNAALEAAAASGLAVIPVYVLNEQAETWRFGGASRWWLSRSLRALDAGLRRLDSRLILRRGEAVAALTGLAEETGAEAVFFTRGYEPFIVRQETALNAALRRAGIGCRRFGGNLLCEPEAVANKSGEPFKVFTPFYKACQAKEPVATPIPAPKTLTAPAVWPDSEPLESWALEPSKPDWAREMREFWTPGEAGANSRLQAFMDGALADYAAMRDRPDIDGTSRLSPHLAFGEISPRQAWHAIDSAAGRDARLQRGAVSYIRELYWREFSYHLLFHWPTLPEQPFREEFGALPWAADKKALAAWRKGRTGYPVVDAGMRQLWAIGWMHNRVRMVAASLLTKHLLIPWREGEDWFWDTLVDADLANNAASWQWVAGSGADAAPYFRVFNPILQGKKFDPEGNYVRRWVPELAGMSAEHIHAPWEAPESVLRKAGVTLGVTYPLPIIEHEKGRRRALEAYEAVKAANQRAD